MAQIIQYTQPVVDAPRGQPSLPQLSRVSNSPSQPVRPRESTPPRRTLDAMPAPAPASPCTTPASSSKAAPSRSEERVPATALPPNQFFRSEVLLAGRVVPSWVLCSALALTAAVTAGLLSAAARSGGAPASALITPSTEERAAAGEPDAIKELESKPPQERTVDEIVALAEGRASRSKAALDSLADELERNPTRSEDPNVLRKLHEATENPELARRALRILAAMPGPRSADIIYNTWVGTKERTETTRLAQELVYSEPVRSRASPELSVALKLREAKTCEDVSALLDSVVAQGDRRALSPLLELRSQKGCGPKKADDCYACLRNDDRLNTAISAVVERDPPA